jgi:hypothetical protein
MSGTGVGQTYPSFELDLSPNAPYRHMPVEYLWRNDADARAAADAQAMEEIEAEVERHYDHFLAIPWFEAQIERYGHDFSPFLGRLVGTRNRRTRAITRAPRKFPLELVAEWLVASPRLARDWEEHKATTLAAVDAEPTTYAKIVERVGLSPDDTGKHTSLRAILMCLSLSGEIFVQAPSHDDWNAALFSRDKPEHYSAPEFETVHPGFDVEAEGRSRPPNTRAAYPNNPLDAPGLRDHHSMSGV